jgi:PAS domain S-box-containing protein
MEQNPLKRLVDIAMTMAIVSVAVCGVTLTVLYRASISQLEARFSDMANDKSAVISMLIRHGQLHREKALKEFGGIPQMVLSQLVTLNTGYATLGRTGEYAVAERKGDRIKFLIRMRRQNSENLVELPWAGHEGTPMKRALSGLTGVLKGEDYQGVTVLAAYSPVPGTKWGVVVKMNMSEVREPFFRAGVYAVLACLILVGLGTFLVYRLGIPIARGVEEASRLYQGMFNSSADPIVLLDPQMRVVDLNESAKTVFGIIDGAFERIVAKESLAPVRSALAGLAGRTVRKVEAKLHRPDGSNFPAELKVTPMKQAGREHLLVSIRDLTEQERAEEARKKMDANMQHTQKLESLGVLAGGIAHDFNNILMGVLGNADLAMLEVPEGSVGRRRLDNIVVSAQRAAGLCQQMLAYSGHGKFVVELLDLSSLVQDICQLIEVTLSKRAVVQYNLKRDLPLVEGDATQIRQVVMNLVMNASEAVGEKSGMISISTGAMVCDRNYLDTVSGVGELKEGDYVYLEVSDTGCGMTEEVKNRIFDPFFTTKFTGRGLGMSAVLGIMRGHKGAIKVYTEPGRGSTIKALFPATKSGAGMTEAGHPVMLAWKGSGTVLLADDDETLRVVVKAMLEGLGFSVETAVDGRECVEKFKSGRDRFAVVIVDLTMPHMGGQEVFEEIRRMKKDTRVILSSGYNEQEVISRFVGRGLAGFLKKPYRREELEAKLREVLGS